MNKCVAYKVSQEHPWLKDEVLTHNTKGCLSSWTHIHQTWEGEKFVVIAASKGLIYVLGLVLK